jgi:cytoskeleton protein RodZ
MKEAPGTATTGTSATAPTGSATPGGLLRQERERRGATVLQAAEDLHLDPKLVEAIEANRFEALGAPVYARGHLRKYAALLNLSPEVILSRYEALTGTPEVPTPIPASAPPPPRRLSLRIPLTLAAIAIGVLVLWWVLSELMSPGEPVSSSEPSPALPERSMGSSPSVPQVAAAPPSTPVELPPQAATTSAAPPPLVQATATQNAVTEPAGDPLQLRLEFSEPSWVEVYDATGKRLLYGTGTPERARSVSGIAPLRVVLGLASVVTLQANGQVIAIPPRAGRDGTRFEVGLDGAVR